MKLKEMLPPEKLAQLEGMEFSVDAGSHFIVLLFDDFVLKLPRRKRYKEKMPFIAKAQTELSEKIDGVLPCTFHEVYLEMPRAPGIPGNDIKNDKTKNYVRELRDNTLKEIRKYGYQVKSCKMQDTFYHEEEDMVYIIDFSDVEKL